MRSPSTRTRLCFAVLVAASVFAMASCAAAPAAKTPAEEPAQTPAPAPGSYESFAEDRDKLELETVDDAALAFEQAERALASSFDEAGADEEGDRAFDRPGQPSRQPAPMALGRGDRCARACSALGSMKRSAARLCELTGQDDPRCSSVAERVSAAVDRVRASCPDCQQSEP